MERLTTKFMDGYVLPMLPISPFLDINELNKFHKVRREYEANTIRLGEYEDAGLEPSEIAEHEEMFKAYRHACGGMSPEEIASLKESIAEYQRLEQEDLLVRLPCKVGDRVYCTYGRSYKVSGVEKGLGGIKIYGISDNFLGYYGKEVFLTQAEAKQALKEVNHVRD